MTLEELVYIDDTGFHVADYSEFLAWQQANMQAIYGADIYLEADSQDGQYVALQAKALYDTAMVGASVYNSFSPSSAQGTGLSRVVKINGLERGIPTNSTADLTIVGQSGQFQSSLNRTPEASKWWQLCERLHAQKTERMKIFPT